MRARSAPILAALALGVACSSSSKETRTASTEAGASQPAPVFVGGRVATVDQANDRLRLIQPGGPDLVIAVTGDTQFVDQNGQTMTQGLASLQEGEQVRASLDPTSHRAVRIEVMPAPQPSR
jgi:hypothetical protein